MSEGMLRNTRPTTRRINLVSFGSKPFRRAISRRASANPMGPRAWPGLFVHRLPATCVVFLSHDFHSKPSRVDSAVSQHFLLTVAYPVCRKETHASINQVVDGHIRPAQSTALPYRVEPKAVAVQHLEALLLPSNSLLR